MCGMWHEWTRLISATFMVVAHKLDYERMARVVSGLERVVGDLVDD
jgi:hypothetical protein